MVRGKVPFCEMFNSDNKYVMKIRQRSSFPPGNYCPLPKNRYAINELEFDDDDLPAVALQNTYTFVADVIAPDGHRVFAYAVKCTVK